MARFALFVAFAVAALAAGSARLHACTCVLDSLPCAPEWFADAVFVGEVTAIDPLTEPHILSSRRITFAARENFKGIEGRLVEVRTGSGGGDCGFAFGVGNTYLDFAHREPLTGRLYTGICSSTALVERSEGNLKRLRAPVRQLESPALVHGRAVRSELQSIRTPRVNEPFAGARVRLKGELGSWETVTAADGSYEFRVPAGRYRLTVETGDQFYSDPDDAVGLDVRVVDAKPCAPIEIRIHSNGRIRGRLIDSSGRGIPFLSLDLADRSNRNTVTLFPEARTITDAEGRFLFDRIAPGEYDIGLTLRRFLERPDPKYPIFLQSNLPIDVGLETSLDTGTIRIPDGIEIRQVTGVVVDEAGVPVSNVEVRVETRGRDRGVSSEPVMTDARGRFLISAIAGRIVELVAAERSGIGDRPGYRTARSPTFDAAVVQGPLTLIVKTP